MDVTVQIDQSKIRGLNSSRGVSSFIGIPFATIPARFRQAALIENYNDSKYIDATIYGPCCPQPVDVGRLLRSHLYNGRDELPSRDASEFECLTLNIYTPQEAIHSTTKLPVLLWIHGGGWTVGDGNYDYDGSFLVEKSKASEKPFVYVSLTYRVGYFGFLTSKELRDEALSFGEVGYANQGLCDQRLGLHWVQKYIKYFGGNPSLLTLAGQSAGAWSVIAHLKSKSPAFQHALVMSCPSLPMSSLEESQEIFDRMVAGKGISGSATAAEKLQAVREYTADGLVALMHCRFGQFALPIWDPEWFIDMTTPFERMEQLPQWLDSIVIGSTKHEYALYGVSCASWTAAQFRKAIETSSPNKSFANEIMEVYQMDEKADQVSAFNGFLQFGTDSLFSTVPILIGSRPSPNISLYSFDQTDDFAGSIFDGFAYHSLDNAFFCRFPAVAGPHSPTNTRATSDAFNQSCFDLIYGIQPWETYHRKGQVMSFNGKQTALTKNIGYERWARFVSTDDRRKLFREAGERLLQYTLTHLSVDPAT